MLFRYHLPSLKRNKLIVFNKFNFYIHFAGSIVNIMRCKSKIVKKLSKMLLLFQQKKLFFQYFDIISNSTQLKLRYCVYNYKTCADTKNEITEVMLNHAKKCEHVTWIHVFEGFEPKSIVGWFRLMYCKDFNESGIFVNDL